MKNIFLTIMTLTVGVIAFGSGGCKLGNEAPSVDVTSVWLGSWVGENHSEAGKLMLNLIQEGSKLEGSIYLYNDPPSTANVGTDIKGSVSGSDINFWMDSSDTNHRFTGMVEGGTILEGVINYFGKKGTWTAEKLPTQPLEIAAQLNPPIPTYWRLAFDGKNILVGDVTSSDVYTIDLNGNILNRIHLSDWQLPNISFGEGIAAEGDSIFNPQQGKHILVHSASTGKPKDEVGIPFEVGNFTCAPGVFYATKMYAGEIYELTRRGVVIRQWGCYQYIHSIAHNGQLVCALYPNKMIVGYDSSGRPTSAFRITLPADKEWIIGSTLAWDGECFWIEAEDYSVNPAQKWLLRLRPK